MFKRIAIGSVTCALGLLGGAGAQADIVCPDSSYVCVDFAKTYSGNYQKGQPYDYATISPNGAGQTFASAGITIRVYLRNCLGAPLVGVPAQEVILYNSNLCICPGGNIADSFTDINGCTAFSATLRAGGCAADLSVFADGVLIGRAERNGRCGTASDHRTVKVNSTDIGTASPCFVDASDLADLANRRGAQVGAPKYSICLDWNEDGSIDASDIAAFASVLGSTCQ